MENNKNFVLFVILSVLILYGFNSTRHYWLPEPPPVASVVTPASQPVPQASVQNQLRDRAEVIKETSRVAVNTPALVGSVNLKGARLDDLSFTQYHETVDPASPKVTLLSPSGSAKPHSAHYVDAGWLADTGVQVPDADTLWQAESKILAPGQPLKLTWKNAQGLVFEREMAVDERYMFTITDRVVNTGAGAVTLYPYGAVAQQGTPVVDSKSSYVLHEGLLGVVDGALEEATYKKLVGSSKQSFDSTGGWLGMTSKYWLVALVPPAQEKIQLQFAHDAQGMADPHDGHYQADYRGAGVTVAAGGSATHVTRLFAGAKEIRWLDKYADAYDIPHFDRAIDFGWFYFLTKPFLYLLSFLGHSLGSVGIAILVFTVMLKLMTFPLTLKSTRSMARMKVIQPEIARIKERFPDDPVQQNQQIMEMFKREKVNPASGCVPMMLQIPIFFALYKVLYVGIEMRQAPFYGWIHDMSLPDPTSVLTLFGLINWTPPTALHIGAWPLMMGITMFLQQRTAPQAMDKAQQRMFMLMPVLFTYMLASMPAGLVIYWTWSNLLTIVQQWYMTRHDVRKEV